MLSLIFPPKKHPEDCSEAAAYLAKLVFWAGAACLLWSGFHATRWINSATYERTLGELKYGSLAFVVSGVTNISFDYRVGDKSFTSQNIAFGGRPLGGVPPE